MINLVLVTQRFSPYDKVGARRWSKFIHYLQQYDDINIQIITQKYNLISTNNPWNIELNPAKIKITHINDSINKLKNKFPFLNTFFDLLQYKALGYTDEGYGFSKKAFKYIEKNINNIEPSIIIASSPAYSSCYFASKFKFNNPNVKLINDYRDAWIDGFFSWNIRLTKNDTLYKKQVEMELFSINNCDAVVSVTPELVEKYSQKLIPKKTSLNLITNGFDTRDFSKIESIYPSVFDKNTINICHFGTLDFGRESEFLKFLNTSNIPNSITIYLIGNIASTIIDVIKEHKNIIHLKELPPNELIPFFKNADFHLVVNDLEFYYAYGSKIFDAMLYNKPILFLSKENSLIQKYKNNSTFIHSDNSYELNKQMIHQIMNSSSNQNINPDYQNFDIEKLSQQYYTLIKSLVYEKSIF